MPSSSPFLSRVAALVDQGQVDAALQLCYQTIRDHPDSFEAYVRLAELFRLQGKWAKAAEAYQAAIRLNPQDPELYRWLGDMFGHAGQLPLAAQTFRQELALRPSHVRAWLDLGLALQMQRQFLPAEEAFRRATQLDPASALPWHRLGVCRGQQGFLDDAVRLLQQALQCNAADPVIWHDLGVALEKLGRLADATAAYERAVALRPASIEDLHCWAHGLYRAFGRYEQALALAERVLQLQPQHVDAHGLRALILLTLGRLDEGWQEYAWRRKAKNFESPRRNYGRDDWHGHEPLAGRTILLYPEQGLGDTIQFVRYAALLAHRQARVIVESPPELTRLLAQAPGVAQVFPWGSPLPPFDLLCSLMSLPLALAALEPAIPADIPYLTARPEWIVPWRQRLAALPPRPCIGLAWAGRPAHSNDKNRSTTLETLRPLFETARQLGIEFVSLQKGDAARQRPADLPLIDWTDQITDLADTAGLLATLDLVITVDTSVAHLAGAMGKPVWVMLPWVPDWRWQLHRCDSPWYPTMRLFRKPQENDWSSVVKDLCAALCQWRAVGSNSRATTMQ